MTTDYDELVRRLRSPSDDPARDCLDAATAIQELVRERGEWETAATELQRRLGEALREIERLEQEESDQPFRDGFRHRD